MEQLTRAWDWSKNKDKHWITPSEESYYLLNRWKDKNFSKFLDLGCGLGRHSIQFARNGFNVDSVDLSELAVDMLNNWANKEKLDLKAKVSNMMDLPFSENYFDCLLAYHVISHTDSKGIVQVLSEIRRVLKENGEFYLTLCSKQGLNLDDPELVKLDENTIVKTEEGPEQGIPHFFVNDDDIKGIFKDIKLITVRQVQDVIVGGENYNSWHYFILGKK
jgi:ubiquinone/menaquinone biosynthesis C-methylase UbiE